MAEINGNIMQNRAASGPPKSDAAYANRRQWKTHQSALVLHSPLNPVVMKSVRVSILIFNAMATEIGSPRSQICQSAIVDDLGGVSPSSGHALPII
ncbi:hypothetical protein ACLOJK_000941 [Asimina triloba]